MPGERYGVRIVLAAERKIVSPGASVLSAAPRLQGCPDGPCSWGFYSPLLCDEHLMYTCVYWKPSFSFCVIKKL
jgi:hypothetical protein